MSEAFRLLPAADHRKMRWLNGGGWTSEIIAWPNPEDWEFELVDIELAIIVSGHPHLGDNHLTHLDAIRPLADSPAIVLSAASSEPATIGVIA
jgi:hypothetical protein